MHKTLGAYNQAIRNAKETIPGYNGRNAQPFSPPAPCKTADMPRLAPTDRRGTVVYREHPTSHNIQPRGFYCLGHWYEATNETLVTRPVV